MIAGFTSAAALTIASGQWKSLLGVSIDPAHKSHTHAGVVDYYVDIFHNISTVRPQDAVLGLVCCVILLSLRVCVCELRELLMAEILYNIHSSFPGFKQNGLVQTHQGGR